MGSIQEGNTTKRAMRDTMAQNTDNPTGAGKSSFELIDTAKFFRLLDLRKGISSS